MNPLPNYKLAIIKWEDHCGGNTWRNLEEAAQDLNIGYECISVGWVIAENKQRIILAPHLALPNKFKNMPDVCGEMMISKKLIISIKYIK